MTGYFALTGNSFVDAGVFVLSGLLRKSPEQITPEDLKESLDTILFLQKID